MIRKLTLSLVIAASVSMFALPSYGQISSIGELLDNKDNLPVRGVPSGFSKLAKQLSPSVVNISTAQTVEVNTDDAPAFPKGSPLEPVSYTHLTLPTICSV